MIIDALRAAILKLVRLAFREGFEAGYLAAQSEDAQKLTFTYIRDDLSAAAYLKSAAHREARNI